MEKNDNIKYNLCEVYDKLIQKSQKKEIASHCSGNYNGIINPESEIMINRQFGLTFKIDKEGMHDILKEIEKQINNLQKPEIWDYLISTSNIINFYFNGKGNDEIRKNAYMKAKKETLTLSMIQGKNIGQCAERASVAQNCLVTLTNCGIIDNFNPRLVVSKMYEENGKGSQHAFLILENKNPNKKSILFDIENKIHIKVNGKTAEVDGLYIITSSELERFNNGEAVQPKDVWSLSGFEVITFPYSYSENNTKLIQKGR